jgi:lysozyme family protein
MRDNFEPTVRFILEEEGGYVVDHAGATKMGLTIGLMRALKLDLNHDGAVDEKDVALVDADLVRKVFRAQFWDPIGGDALISGLDLLASDFGYNAGPQAALTLLKSGRAIEGYALRRMQYYWTLVTRHPEKYNPYFKGWIGRSIRAWQHAEELGQHA